MSQEIDVLIDQAYMQRRLGNHRGAIELLQRALAHDPDHNLAHASLALALLGAKRLAGARIEAQIALGLDGNHPFAHYAMAAVLVAERKLDAAWDHCQIAVQADSDDIDARVLGAQIRSYRNEYVEARELLEEALDLQPSSVSTLTALAQLELELGKLAEATEHVTQALRADPSDLEAHTVAGFIALRKGDTDDAERHARYVLGQNSVDERGLRLWAGLKARRNPLLGLWWRFSMFTSLRSERGQLAISIGSFVAVRLLIILAVALDWDGVARGVGLAWLGFCAYTWFAPAIFRWMLNNDLGTVSLDPNY